MSDLDRVGPAGVCGANEHEQLGIFLVYCQHYQAWQIQVDGGTCNEPQFLVPLMHAGPFNGFLGLRDLVDDYVVEWIRRSELAAGL